MPFDNSHSFRLNWLHGFLWPWFSLVDGCYCWLQSVIVGAIGFRKLSIGSAVKMVAFLTMESILRSHFLSNKQKKNSLALAAWSRGIVSSCHRGDWSYGS
jgi:hypothetical protein